MDSRGPLPPPTAGPRRERGGEGGHPLLPVLSPPSLAGPSADDKVGRASYRNSGSEQERACSGREGRLGVLSDGRRAKVPTANGLSMLPHVGILSGAGCSLRLWQSSAPCVHDVGPGLLIKLLAFSQF
ncbi:unnamed protein product [Prorocentrum cordatum]|uniref:Uncharacterized protein n=1 Tax=Prorocentrum cordatum TaxID=2364126 RepID=A0ABN9THB5_9DINO|nr:unnamed protein product [Polarella glacialis]